MIIAVEPPVQPTYTSLTLIVFGVLDLCFSIFAVAWSFWVMSMDESIFFSYLAGGSGIYYIFMGISAVVAGKNIFKFRILIVICLIMGIFGLFVTIFINLVTLELDGRYSCLTTDLSHSVWCINNYSIYEILLLMPRLNATFGAIISLVICCTRCSCCVCCYIEDYRPGYVIRQGPSPALYSEDMFYLRNLNLE